MKIWVDDIRPKPPEYDYSCHSTNEAIEAIQLIESIGYLVELVDLDHDAGDYVKNGGDYIRVLEWLEKTGRNYPIRIHTMNPVGRENMRNIIHKNGWKEIF